MGCNVLMTSVSMYSRSESVPDALRTGGGYTRSTTRVKQQIRWAPDSKVVCSTASMSAAVFFFLAVKKLPKKLPSSKFMDEFRLALACAAGDARPPCCPGDGLIFSFT